jgi:tRNA threonylcarbamoyladenosine biosynthesis protein TsaB
MILAIKTAEAVAELFLLDLAGDDLKILVAEKWQADRELLDNLLVKIQKLVADFGFEGLTGLIVFAGPGSFTGLRIGISTMNALAYAQKIPIVGATGTDWLLEGSKKLKNGLDELVVGPDYGDKAKNWAAK